MSDERSPPSSPPRPPGPSVSFSDAPGTSVAEELDISGPPGGPASSPHLLRVPAAAAAAAGVADGPPPWPPHPGMFGVPRGPIPRSVSEAAVRLDDNPGGGAVPEDVHAQGVFVFPVEAGAEVGQEGATPVFVTVGAAEALWGDEEEEESDEDMEEEGLEPDEEEVEETEDEEEEDDDDDDDEEEEEEEEGGEEQQEVDRQRGIQIVELRDDEEMGDEEVVLDRMENPRYSPRDDVERRFDASERDSALDTGRGGESEEGRTLSNESPTLSENGEDPRSPQLRPPTSSPNTAAESMQQEDNPVSPILTTPAVAAAAAAQYSSSPSPRTPSPSPPAGGRAADPVSVAEAVAVLERRESAGRSGVGPPRLSPMDIPIPVQYGEEERRADAELDSEEAAENIEFDSARDEGIRAPRAAERTSSGEDEGSEGEGVALVGEGDVAVGTGAVLAAHGSAGAEGSVGRSSSSDGHPMDVKDDVAEGGGEALASGFAPMDFKAEAEDEGPEENREEQPRQFEEPGYVASASALSPSAAAAPASIPGVVFLSVPEPLQSSAHAGELEDNGSSGSGSGSGSRGSRGSFDSEEYDTAAAVANDKVVFLSEPSGPDPVAADTDDKVVFLSEPSRAPANDEVPVTGDGDQSDGVVPGEQPRLDRERTPDVTFLSVPEMGTVRASDDASTRSVGSGSLSRGASSSEIEQANPATMMVEAQVASGGSGVHPVDQTLEEKASDHDSSGDHVNAPETAYQGSLDTFERHHRPAHDAADGNLVNESGILPRATVLAPLDPNDGVPRDDPIGEIGGDADAFEDPEFVTPLTSPSAVNRASEYGEVEAARGGSRQIYGMQDVTDGVGSSVVQHAFLRESDPAHDTKSISSRGSGGEDNHMGLTEELGKDVLARASRVPASGSGRASLSSSHDADVGDALQTDSGAGRSDTDDMGALTSAEGSQVHSSARYIAVEGVESSRSLGVVNDAEVTAPYNRTSPVVSPDYTNVRPSEVVLAGSATVEVASAEVKPNVRQEHQADVLSASLLEPGEREDGDDAPVGHKDGGDLNEFELPKKRSDREAPESDVKGKVDSNSNSDTKSALPKAASARFQHMRSMSERESLRRRVAQYANTLEEVAKRSNQQLEIARAHRTQAMANAIALREENESLGRENGALRAKIHELESVAVERDAARREREVSDRSLFETKAELAAATREIELLRSSLAEKDAVVVALRKELSEQLASKADSASHEERERMIVSMIRDFGAVASRYVPELLATQEGPSVPAASAKEG